ncbi:MAG: family 10 glycosylhydrolase [Acidobacteria bacterium]|nr:family 10 glycosylhydrolase [Acidobacteriota bacterium]
MSKFDPPEIRALWVDAFHAGIRSPQEADELIAAARRAHLNTLFVQVRRRGDALYTKGVEPPLDDPAYDSSFDALAYIVDGAHREGLQVHAWVNAMPTWRDEAPPRDARHLFNRHGPAAAGEENWFTASPSGDHKFPVGYFVDPGHPAAAAYLVEIYLNIVRSYDVDGIHFDYIRYPETAERLPRGAGVGYNAVALERFRRNTGRTDMPAPGDEAWMAWRRAQVTSLVRRISIEAKAIKPHVKVSAAVIPWGVPPTNEKDFADVAPMQRVFQNWHEWMREGLIDLAVPMNYATETDARVRDWFNGWIRWEKRHKHGRQLAVGVGAYRNAPEATLAQIARIRTARGNDRDDRIDGVSLFSYAVPRLAPEIPATVAPGSPPQFPADANHLAFLVDGAGAAQGAFTRPAPVPSMPWIDRPSRGFIAGTVTAETPRAADAVEVRIKREGTWAEALASGFGLFRRTHLVRTDGNGYFGVTNLKPGRYRVWRDDLKKGPVRVRVEAGKVARADM